MKRLIKKMPHRQGLENYILAYANEKDGQWQDDGQPEWEDSGGNGKDKTAYQEVRSASRTRNGGRSQGLIDPWSL